MSCKIVGCNFERYTHFNGMLLSSFKDSLHSKQYVKKVYWKYTEVCCASSVAVVVIFHLINIRSRDALVNK
jgi:hypothetical protein